MISPPVFATGAAPAYLTDAVVLFVAGALIAYLSFRLRLVPIVGFLIAGVLIGPHALGLVSNLELVDSAAEVGVILLLFTIGIEFSLEKLARMKRLIVVGGGLQVGLSCALTMGVLAIFGVDWRTGLFAGFLVALSSTAIVLKVLADRGETNSEPGQVALGLLIFQDLAVIVMVLMIPMLSGSGSSGIGIIWALAKAVILITVILFFARRLMPRILEKVAETCSPELFLLTVIAICFGTAFLTSLAGVSLSLGAFLAGLLISESRFSHHALGEIMPLQILFSATFFVSVGILLDLRFLVTNLPLVLAVVAGALIVKLITTGLSALLLGYRLPIAGASALMLAQIGEFSFVLERTGRDAGLTPAGMAEVGSQSFIAGTVVLMVMTPFMMQIGSRFARQVKRTNTPLDEPNVRPSVIAEHAELHDHVIIAGYGKVARSLVCVLGGSGIPYIITTLSPEGANEAEAGGLRVLRGDYSRTHTLERAGISRAKMMVIADDEPPRAQSVVAVGKTLNPGVRTVVRTRYLTDVQALEHAGADVVIAAEMESVVRIFHEVMSDYGIPREEITAHERTVREAGYSALSPSAGTGPAPVLICNVDQGALRRRTLTVRSGAPVIGSKFSELHLDDFGVNLEKLVRGDGTGRFLESDEPIQAGDEVILSGTSLSFSRIATLFRTPTDTSQAGVPIDDSTVVMQGSDLTAGAGVDIERTIIFVTNVGASTCGHLDQIKPVIPSANGCEQCLELGDKWVQLRVCLTCGQVGCCDSSKNRHATAHYADAHHALVQSLERGEDWGWCYVDETYL